MYQQKTKKNIFLLSVVLCLFWLSVSPVLCEENSRYEDLSYPLNINEVTLQELAVVEGVSQRQAELIINFRKRIGVIQKLEILQTIRGIGPKTWQRLKRNTFVSFKDQPIETTQNSEFTTIQNSTPRLDLNRCDSQRLCSIRGIGKKTAEAIINLRTQIGGFTSYGDLRMVKGMGPKRVEAIKKQFFIAGEVE
jgi:competence protein ComEA